MSIEPEAEPEPRVDAPASEPVRYDTAEYQIPATRADRHGRRRFTPVGVFVWAFIALMLAGVSVAIANFNAGSSRFAWISIALSAGAIVLAVAALLIRPKE